MTEQTRYHPNGEATVTSQDQRHSAAGDSLVDAIGCLPGHVHDECEVLSPGVLGFRMEGDRGEVAQVGSATSRSFARSRSSSPAARNAAGALSCPVRRAPALDGTPINANLSIVCNVCSLETILLDNISLIMAIRRRYVSQ